IQSDLVRTPRSNWTCSAGDASAFHKVSPRFFPQERNTYSEQTTDQVESTTWKQKILQEVPQGTINSPKDLQNASVKPKADEASDKTEQKLIIEKCKRLRPKPKRYSRSETMPLSVNADVIKDIEKFWSKRNPSQEIDEKHEKRKSMPSHTNEGIAPPIPALTQRFKKPSLKNRRVPSRWKKENDN
uniref:Uncharacterized protein n=1 Tax=Ciona savignyi TaxID=51511 RepID=H2YN09_CIOSA